MARRTGTALILGGLALMLAVPPASASVATSHHETSPRLRATINGIPLRQLAIRAVGAARAYGVHQPSDVQVVQSSESALWGLGLVAGGNPAPEYIIELRGRFSCSAGCDTSDAPSLRATTTTATTTPSVSTMILQIPTSPVSGTNGIYVGVGTPDLAMLGRVYSLDAYVKSLAHVKVTIGPLPG